MPKTGSLYAIARCIILFIASAYYHHPSERILAQTDVASYLFSGVSLARGDGVAPRKPLLNSMPAEVRACTVQTRSPLGLRDDSPKLQSRPFYLEWQMGKTVPGDLVARFPPGYPAVLSLGYRLAGWTGALAVNGLLVLICGLLVTYLACEFAGSAAGLYAAILWAVFPINVWISNTTLAEPLVLLFALVAVAAWAKSRGSQDKLWPILIGICVGVAPVVKLDAIPWIILPLGYWWENRRDNVARPYLPLVAMIPCLIVSVLVLLYAPSGYAAESVHGLSRQPAIWLGVGATIAILILGVVFTWNYNTSSKVDSNNKSDSKDENTSKLALWLKRALFLLAISVFGYLYFVRPEWSGSDKIYWTPLGRVVPSLRELSLVRLGWYLPPCALWIAILSAVAMALWSKETWTRTFAAVGVLVLLFLSYDIINFPRQPFASRRFLPEVIPVLFVALAGTSVWLKRENRHFRWGNPLVGLIVLYTVGFGINVNSKMNFRSDAEGFIDKIRLLSDTVGPKGILVLRQSNSFSEVAPMVAFGFQRDVLSLKIQNAEETRSVEQYLIEQERSGREIWLWTNGPNDRMGLSGYPSGPAFSEEITVPLLHMTTTDQPLSWEERKWIGSLRRISFKTTLGLPGKQHGSQP